MPADMNYIDTASPSYPSWRNILEGDAAVGLDKEQ